MRMAPAPPRGMGRHKVLCGRGGCCWCSATRPTPTRQGSDMRRPSPCVLAVLGHTGVAADGMGLHAMAAALCCSDIFCVCGENEARPLEQGSRQSSKIPAPNSSGLD